MNIKDNVIILTSDFGFSNFTLTCVVFVLKPLVPFVDTTVVDF